MSGVAATILAVAAQEGVPGPLALAIAQQESGLNPQAVGDNGTSFGLYQLHQGGELGNLTKAQAFNPVTNAQVALGQLAATIAANPTVTDPGTLAALAQRPADPAAYAQSIDSILAGNTSGTGNTTGSTGTSTAAGGTVQTTSVLGDLGNAVGGAIGGILGPVGATLGEGAAGAAGSAAHAVASGLSAGSIGAVALQVVLDAVLVAAGLGLIILGVTRLFPNAANHIPIPLPV